nr:MAG TPA: hypothetical protein [Caudoviricetes sp.]
MIGLKEDFRVLKYSAKLILSSSKRKVVITKKRCLWLLYINRCKRHQFTTFCYIARKRG